MSMSAGANPMSNTHSEEAERIVLALFPDPDKKCQPMGVCDVCNERIAIVYKSLHSAVQKEREEFAEAVKNAYSDCFKPGWRGEKPNIIELIDLIQSEREKL